MSRYEKNKSVVACLAAAYKKDKSTVEKYIHGLIDNDEYVLDLGKVNKIWGGRSIQLGTKFDNYNEGRPTLDKQAYAKGGKIWRKMSMGTFIKTRRKGQYLIRLEKEMILIRDGYTIVGDYNSKSRIINAFKIN